MGLIKERPGALITKMLCNAGLIEVYRSNVLFKCDILSSIFRAAA